MQETATRVAEKCLDLWPHRVPQNLSEAWDLARMTVRVMTSCIIEESVVYRETGNLIVISGKSADFLLELVRVDHATVANRIMKMIEDNE